MADFLEEKRREIQARLRELRPLVEEYHKLEAAEKALAGAMSNGGTTSRTRTTTRRNAAKAAPKRAATGTRKRGRPKGSGTRGVQAHELVKAQPGITIPELATAMGIKQNYLYRLMPQLAKDGKVSKKGRGWHPKG